jgi:hypothetical protein
MKSVLERSAFLQSEVSDLPEILSGSIKRANNFLFDLAEDIIEFKTMFARQQICLKFCAGGHLLKTSIFADNNPKSTANEKTLFTPAGDNSLYCRPFGVRPEEKIFITGT